MSNAGNGTLHTEILTTETQRPGEKRLPGTTSAKMIGCTGVERVEIIRGRPTSDVSDPLFGVNRT
jgi:hypothetical protein